jgi:ATP-dependent DNA helicase RecQ
MQKALEILDKHWQYKSFRPLQDAIIQSVLDGKDTFGLMPTGGGKSLCFQVPTLVVDGLCIVISPLVALMKDQVNQLQLRGIKAIALTGSIHSDDLINLLDNFQFGNYKFLYLSPERLEQEWVIARLKTLPISLITIDEAHCVSQWGQDFRPSYLKIKTLKEHFPKTPFLALTATATPQVIDDILNLLGMQNAQLFQKSFARENLGYYLIEVEDKIYKLDKILKKNPEPSIIYVRNRKSCHDVSDQLISLGYKATFYHGGLSAKIKDTNMTSWMLDKTPIMVATNAFGLGIDKPNVKTVVHINFPENLESYYQEAGRAGRNGEKAFAILLHSKSDVLRAKSQFLGNLPDVTFLKFVYLKLCNFLKIAFGEGINEEFVFNLNRFCARYELPVAKTYAALQFLDRQSVLSLSQEFSEKAQVQFIISSKEVIRYMSLNKNDELVISTMLRTYPGIFEISSTINIPFIATKTNTLENDIITLFEKLNQKGIISFISQHNESKLTFLEVREDERTINRVAKHLEKQNLVKKQQLESVLNYISDFSICKNKLLLAYFGEIIKENCNNCSFCNQNNTQKIDLISIKDKITLLLNDKPLNSRQILNAISVDDAEVLNVLKLLLEKNIISITASNKYQLI